VGVGEGVGAVSGVGTVSAVGVENNDAYNDGKYVGSV
jgi:hypothetical protein